MTTYNRDGSATVQELLDRIAELDEICRRSLARATKSENAMVAIQAELEKLRTEETRLLSAVKNYLSGDYQRPIFYRPNQCPHDRYYHEECCECDDEYWRSVLSGSSTEQCDDNL